MSANPSGAPPPRLKLHTYTTEDATVVKCSGKLTSDVTAVLKAEVKGLIPQARRIVLDLSELIYMDSSGLGTVVGLYVSAKTSHCELHLVNLSPRVKELLGITRILSVYETFGEHMLKLP